MTVIRNSFYGDALQTGQIWIGTDTAHPPAAALLTAGTNIAITPTSGSITIGTSGLASLTWQYNNASSTLVPFVGYSTGTSFSIPAYTLPATMTLGDMFAVTAPNTTFSITRNNANQKIFSSGSTGNTLTVTNTGSTIFLLCSLDLVGNTIISVMNYNGPFDLT